jgi:two-component system, cell cycle response regulator DivK
MSRRERALFNEQQKKNNAMPPLVLVVDDFAPGRDVLAELLIRAGYEVAVAEDGRTGIDQARRLQPDLTLMDLAMPVKDGWTATRELKSEPETAALAIAAVTAEPNLDPTTLREAGFCALIRKPFGLGDMLEAVRLCVEGGSRGAVWIDLPPAGGQW